MASKGSQGLERRPCCRALCCYASGWVWAADISAVPGASSSRLCRVLPLLRMPRLGGASDLAYTSGVKSGRGERLEAVPGAPEGGVRLQAAVGKTRSHQRSHKYRRQF